MGLGVSGSKVWQLREVCVCGRVISLPRRLLPSLGRCREKYRRRHLVDLGDRPENPDSPRHKVDVSFPRARANNLRGTQRDQGGLSPSQFPMDWSHQSQIVVLGGLRGGGGCCMKESGRFEVKIFSEVCAVAIVL